MAAINELQDMMTLIELMSKFKLLDKEIDELDEEFDDWLVFMGLLLGSQIMSLIHIPGAQQGAGPDQATIGKMLAENAQLIEAIAEYQRMGKIEDALSYQELLHRNLIYLGNLADASLVQQIQDNRNVSPRTSQPLPTSNGPVSHVNGHSPYGANHQQITHPSNSATPPMLNGQAVFPPSANPNYYGDPNQQYSVPAQNQQSLSPFSNIPQNPPVGYTMQASLQQQNR